MVAKTTGILGPLVGVSGSLAACEAIKILCYLGDDKSIE